MEGVASIAMFCFGDPEVSSDDITAARLLHRTLTASRLTRGRQK
jgi:hypothetical protein